MNKILKQSTFIKCHRQSNIISNTATFLLQSPRHDVYIKRIESIEKVRHFKFKCRKADIGDE